MKILIISDNDYLFKKVNGIVTKKNIKDITVDYGFSYTNIDFIEKYKNRKKFRTFNLKQNSLEVAQEYDLILSVHCNQIFPKELVNNTRCINIHPGYNPYNRGWYPHIFSLINLSPIGVTIHEMDEKIDHGAIIVQEKINVESWETSKEIYERILELEILLLEENLERIINGNYSKIIPSIEGIINNKFDFNRLCQLNLNKHYTMKEAVDLLRALTHGDYKNAFFIDGNGQKVWVRITLEKEEKCKEE